MSREQDLKAAFINAISRFNVGQENLSPFQNDLKGLMSKYMQCNADQISFLDKDGTGPGAPAFDKDHWSFVMAVKLAGIEMQIAIDAAPGLDAETFFIAKIRNELTGFQIPQKQHALVEHIYKAMQSCLDNAVFEKKPDKPIRVGF